MKRTTLLIIFALLAAFVLYACAHSSVSRPALTPDTSAAVGPQAASLVGDNDPHMAARLLVEWLAETPATDRTFAMDFTREVYRLYSVSTDSGTLEAFASTLEEAKDSLPLDRQVNVFVAVSSPATLGQMLRNDPQADTIVAMIISRYGADSASVASFLNSYNSY